MLLKQLENFIQLEDSSRYPTQEADKHVMRKKLGSSRLSALESISRWKAKLFFELFVLLSSTVLLILLFNSAYSSSYYLNLF